MSLKALSWTLLSCLALFAVIVFNYWASFQPLSTIAYAGFVMVLFGLANLALPFRFLGIQKRAIGALLLVVGVGLALTGLLWPAPTIHVAQRQTVLDDVMPEYQFSERHSTRINASPELVMQAVRQATWGDLKSLVTLMKIRGALSGAPFQENGYFARDKQVIDAFLASGYVMGGNEREIILGGGANVRAGHVLKPRDLQEYADYREGGTVKMAFHFKVEDAGGGWSKLTAETRVTATDDDTRRGMGRYWRLIVPGSGLLRREWLDGIKKRAESAPNTKS